ncbi:MAG: uroporphyrinogen-III decarboxylase, partial [Thermoleophilia bacterium]|nr:uroporphyrinogen-III decarboxylase [Thermoleophilia bacterium]
MTDKAPAELLREREKRIRDAVALRKPDLIPVVPNGPAWPARHLGVKLADMVTDPQVSYRTMLEAYSRLGEIDGIQSPSFHVSSLSIQWLSRVKLPGRDLPEGDMWQVDEAEIMTPEDYDAIVAEGFESWVNRYYATRLPG